MTALVEAAAGGLRRTIATMESRATSRRDLVLAAMTVVGLSRFAEGAAIWVVAVLLLVAMLLGTLQVLANADPLGESRDAFRCVERDAARRRAERAIGLPLRVTRLAPLRDDAAYRGKRDGRRACSGLGN